MRALLCSPYFALVLTITAYWTGVTLQRKTGKTICNYMIIAMAIIISVLVVFDIPFDTYYEGVGMITMLVGPATACMAVPIYRKAALLKKYWLPILAGCTAGAATAMFSILIMCRLFGLEDIMTLSILPKTVTTPIATAISQGQGGIGSITSAAVVITGIGGNLMAPFLVKLFRINDPMAAGLGIGTCSHAIGTAKAMEMGETQGAMSSLAIGLCGIITTFFSLFYQFLL